MDVKKLIEVALPLEAINEGCAQEKNPFLRKHPRSMHLWWARRPLAAARAVLFAQLVNDPSSLPDEFPTEELQIEERRRLFSIMEKIVKWKNINDDSIMDEARWEIKKSWKRYCSSEGQEDNFDKLPWIHDPFAGGGSIPFEAQRLGLCAAASDLNPVAVMTNRAMIEYPHRFADHTPINPESKRLLGLSWGKAEGLAEDVRYYGVWIQKKATERIGYMYPVDNCEVELSLEVSAQAEDGLPQGTVRTVSENCRTFRVDNFGFGK